MKCADIPLLSFSFVFLSSRCNAQLWICHLCDVWCDGNWFKKWWFRRGVNHRNCEWCERSTRLFWFYELGNDEPYGNRGRKFPCVLCQRPWSTRNANDSLERYCHCLWSRQEYCGCKKWQCPIDIRNASWLRILRSVYHCNDWSYRHDWSYDTCRYVYGNAYSYGYRKFRLWNNVHPQWFTYWYHSIRQFRRCRCIAWRLWHERGPRWH